MAELLTTLTGFILGIVGAWLFWRYQVKTKPAVCISDFVLKGTDRVDQATTVYRIKLYNSGSRQVVNLQARARIVKRVPGSEGVRWPFIEEVPLRFDGAFPALGRRQDKHDPLQHVPPGAILTIEGGNNLERLLPEHHRLMLTVSATDAESNMSVVIRKSFSRASILSGDFPIGPALAPLTAAAETHGRAALEKERQKRA